MRSAIRVGSADRGAVTRPPALDDVDHAVIEALQRDGREPFRRIARRIGVSEATVRARYGRLCDRDVLRVTAVTNPLGLGFEGTAMIGVRVAGSPERAAEAVAAIPEAEYVVVTAGQFDVLTEVICADRRALLDLVGRIREIDGVVSTEAFLYLDLVKQMYDWGVRVAEEDDAGAEEG
jgi:Lrp/AsnC family transcriptional regulator, regulator for asnA, asnC and gidA